MDEWTNTPAESALRRALGSPEARVPADVDEAVLGAARATLRRRARFERMLGGARGVAMAAGLGLVAGVSVWVGARGVAGPRPASLSMATVQREAAEVAQSGAADRLDDATDGPRGVDMVDVLRAAKARDAAARVTELAAEAVKLERGRS